MGVLIAIQHCGAPWAWAKVSKNSAQPIRDGGTHSKGGRAPLTFFLDTPPDGKLLFDGRPEQGEALEKAQTRANAREDKRHSEIANTQNQKGEGTEEIARR